MAFLNLDELSLTTKHNVLLGNYIAYVLPQQVAIHRQFHPHTVVNLTMHRLDGQVAHPITRTRPQIQV